MERDYKMIMAASGLSSTVTAMLYAPMQFKSYDLGQSLVYVGLIGSLPYLGLMVMAYFWGFLSDYLGKRKELVILSGIAGSLLFFIYPFLSSIEHFIAIRFVQVCLMGSVILLIAVATERFPGEKGRIIGDLNIPLAFGWIIGAGIAALTYRDHPLLFFALCGAVGLSSALVLVPLREPRPAGGGNGTASFKGLFSFRNRRQVGILCTATLLLLSGNYIVYSVFPQYLKGSPFGLDEVQIGFLVAGSGLMGVFVFRHAGLLVDRRGRRGVFLAAALTYFLSWSVYAVTTDLWVISIIWVLPYWSFFTTSSTAMVSDLTDERERGRGIGILNASINFGAFAGSLFGGLLAEELGYFSSFGIAAVLAALGFAVALWTRETLPARRA